MCFYGCRTQDCEFVAASRRKNPRNRLWKRWEDRCSDFGCVPLTSNLLTRAGEQLRVTFRSAPSRSPEIWSTRKRGKTKIHQRGAATEQQVHKRSDLASLWPLGHLGLVCVGSDRDSAEGQRSKRPFSSVQPAPAARFFSFCPFAARRCFKDAYLRMKTASWCTKLMLGQLGSG